MDSDFDTSPSKKKHYSREEQLEMLLKGIKDKFNSLTENDPFRLFLQYHLNVGQFRIYVMNLELLLDRLENQNTLINLKDVFAIPDLKAGNTLEPATVKKVIAYYESDINSRI